VSKIAGKVTILQRQAAEHAGLSLDEIEKKFGKHVAREIESRLLLIRSEKVAKLATMIVEDDADLAKVVSPYLAAKDMAEATREEYNVQLQRRRKMFGHLTPSKHT